MDVPSKPKNPAARRPKKKLSAAEERQAAAMAKIAKNYRKMNVAERRSGPQFLAVLLSLLGAALVLYKIFGPELWKSDSVQVSDVAPAPEAGAAAGPIDPRLFRDNLENFERLLLGESSGSDLVSLSEAILRAGGKLTSELQLDTRNSNSRRVGAALQAAIDTVAAKSPPKLEDFAKLRTDWLALRRREFQSADFLLSPQEEGSADQLLLAAYRSQLADLDQILVSAFDRAAALASEPASGETPDEKQQRLAALEGVGRETAEQLDRLKQALPNRPAGNLTPQLMVAIQCLEQAIAEARSLAGSTANLTPAGRSSFGNVESLIGRSRSSLDQLDP